MIVHTETPVLLVVVAEEEDRETLVESFHCPEAIVGNAGKHQVPRVEQVAPGSTLFAKGQQGFDKIFVSGAAYLVIEENGFHVGCGFAVTFQPESRKVCAKKLLELLDASRYVVVHQNPTQVEDDSFNHEN